MELAVQVVSLFRRSLLGYCPEAKQAMFIFGALTSSNASYSSTANHSFQPVAPINQLFESVTAEMLEGELKFQNLLGSESEAGQASPLRD